MGGPALDHAIVVELVVGNQAQLDCSQVCEVFQATSSGLTLLAQSQGRPPFPYPYFEEPLGEDTVKFKS